MNNQPVTLERLKGMNEKELKEIKDKYPGNEYLNFIADQILNFKRK